jgi:RNA polymerase sigma-70 factor (ECF subfamily)
MAGSDSTCWTVIQAAAAGQAGPREEFARHYEPVVRAYLAARWSGRREEVDDAVQDVFVECFRDGGALARVDPDRPGGFRAFLYGVARNVARRIETARARRLQREQVGAPEEEPAADEPGLSTVFDRAWAGNILRQAAVRQAERARASGEPAQRRVELLRLRFHDGLAIRDIARRWQVDAAWAHHEYARAREEFRAALLEVLAFHHPGSQARLEEECARLLESVG